MIERYFIFFPHRGLTGDPSDYGLVHEDVSFASSDGVRLHGWFVAGSSDVTWLWCHGNAGNISHRLENLKLLHDHLGVNVFLFDYRSYGVSEGKPSEQGTYRDAEAALRYLRARDDLSPDSILYFGRSLGAAVAVELASRAEPCGLILESGFPSVPYLARRRYPFLPIWLLLRTRYDARAKIRGLKAPKLVLHGDRDDIVPIDAGRALFDAAKEPKEFYTIAGAGHNDTYRVGGAAYFAALRAFVEQLPCGPGAR